MALQPFWVQDRIRIGQANSDTVAVDLVFGSGVPGGDAAEQDEAAIGSIYFRTDAGNFYRKIATANAPADWERMASDQFDDTFLNSSYDNTTNGSPADGDDAQLAMGYLDANQLDLITLSGVAKGSVDLATFTGSTIQDNRTVKQALQDLESGLEAFSGGNRDQALGVTASTAVGNVLVDDSDCSEWEVLIVDAANNANKKKLKISAIHDGTGAADATVVDFDRFSKLNVGSNFNATIEVLLSGTGVAQDMAIYVTSTEPSGVNVYVRRTDLP